MSIILRTAAIFIVFGMAAIFTTSASASTVSLEPSSTQVAENGVFTVDLTLDASTADVPGTHPGLFSGAIVINYDPTLVSYGNFTINAPALLASGPDIGTDGSLETVTLGFNNFSSPLDAGTIGTFSFTALGDIGNMIDIGLDDMFFLGTFSNLLPTNAKFFPAFSGTTVEIVPVPAAAWLMLSALGVLGFGTTRQRQS